MTAPAALQSSYATLARLSNRVSKFVQEFVHQMHELAKPARTQ